MKATTRQLIDRFCEKYSIVLKEGDGAIFLLPFCIMICALDIFNEKVKPMPLRGAAKYQRAMWAQEYHKFERIILYAYDLDNLADLGELTDGLEQFIAHDLSILHSTIYNNLPVNSAEAKRNIIDALVINVLTQCANVIWTDVFGVECKVLTNLEHIALRLCDCLNPHLEAKCVQSSATGGGCNQGDMYQTNEILGNEDKMKEIKRYETMPEGWKITKGATCHPKGWIWINNGESLFNGKREFALLREK